MVGKLDDPPPLPDFEVSAGEIFEVSKLCTGTQHFDDLYINPPSYTINDPCNVRIYNKLAEYEENSMNLTLPGDGIIQILEAPISGSIHRKFTIDVRNKKCITETPHNCHESPPITSDDFTLKIWHAGVSDPIGTRTYFVYRTFQTPSLIINNHYHHFWICEMDQYTQPVGTSLEKEFFIYKITTNEIWANQWTSPTTLKKPSRLVGKFTINYTPPDPDCFAISSGKLMLARFLESDDSSEFEEIEE